MPIRAVVFDLFDTLVDLDLPRFVPPHRGREPVHSTAERLHEALRPYADVGFDAFAEALRAVDREVWRPRASEGRELPTRERFGHVLERLGLVRDPALVLALTGTHMRVISEHLSTPAHHDALLRELAARWPLGVCSNFTHAPTAYEVLAASRIAPHLSTVVISEDVGFRKPRAEIFEATLAALGAKPEETLHVGDNLDADVGGAAALGIRTAWITRRVADPDALLASWDGPGPDHRIADLAEIPALLRSLG